MQAELEKPEKGVKLPKDGKKKVKGGSDPKILGKSSANKAGLAQQQNAVQNPAPPKKPR